jgi:hypothetical protein
MTLVFETKANPFLIDTYGIIHCKFIAPEQTVNQGNRLKFWNIYGIALDENIQTVTVKIEFIS